MNRKNCVLCVCLFLPFLLFAIACKRNVNTVKHSTVNRLTVLWKGIGSKKRTWRKRDWMWDVSTDMRKMIRGPKTGKRHLLTRNRGVKMITSERWNKLTIYWSLQWPSTEIRLQSLSIKFESGLNSIAVTNGAVVLALELMYEPRMKYIDVVLCCAVLSIEYLANFHKLHDTDIHFTAWTPKILAPLRLNIHLDSISCRSLFLTHNRANCSIPSTGFNTNTKIPCGSRTHFNPLENFLLTPKTDFVRVFCLCWKSHCQQSGQMVSERARERVKQEKISSKRSQHDAVLAVQKFMRADCTYNYVFEYHYDDYYLYWNFCEL